MLIENVDLLDVEIAQALLGDLADMLGLAIGPERAVIEVEAELGGNGIATFLLDMNGPVEPAMGSAFGVAKAGQALLETWRRFISLLDRPDEIAVLAPHLEHELMSGC